MGVFHAHPAGFHPADAPGCCAQQEDIACQTFDRKILIERALRSSVALPDRRAEAQSV